MLVAPLKKVKSVEDKSNRLNLLAPVWNNFNFRMLFIGKTGGGKTTAALSLIFEKHIDFDGIFVYSRFVDKDPSYIALRSFIEEREKKLGETISLWSDSLDDKPFDLKEFNKENRYLFIFDDMITASPKSKKLINDLFIAGRHSNCSVMCMMQDYVGLEPVARKQVTHVAIFEYPAADSLKTIHGDFASSFIDIKKFLEAYNRCLAIKFGFLYIDTTADNVYEKLRFRYDGLYSPIDF